MTEIEMIRRALHQEFDAALDDLLRDVRHRPSVGYETIAIQVSRALLKHAQEQRP